MKLIVILASLGLEHYLNVGLLLKRFSWFAKYMQWLRKLIRSDSAWQGVNGVVLSLAPIVLVVAIIYILVGHIFYGTIGMAISFIVLLYCLGPNDLRYQLQLFFSAKESGNSGLVTTQLENLLPRGIPVDEGQQHRAVTEAIFEQANEGSFAVLFWFLLLGPVGAVLYRGSTLLREYLEVESEARDKKMMSAAATFHELLDWIPARIVALLYGLAGNLNRSFSTWTKLAFSGLRNNRELLTACGLNSLDVQDQSDLNENRAALAAVDRALIIVLVLIAIFTLGAFIY